MRNSILFLSMFVIIIVWEFVYLTRPHNCSNSTYTLMNSAISQIPHITGQEEGWTREKLSSIPKFFPLKRYSPDNNGTAIEKTKKDICAFRIIKRMKKIWILTIIVVIAEKIGCINIVKGSTPLVTGSDLIGPCTKAWEISFCIFWKQWLHSIPCWIAEEFL